MAGFDFELDIEQRLRGGDAITALERIEAAYNDAKTANADFTREAVKATAALEKNAAALEDTKTKLLAAIQAGDEKQVQRLTARFNDLQRTESKLKSDADAAKTALDRQTKVLQTTADKVGALKKQEAEHDKAVELAGKHSEQHAKALQKMTSKVGEAGDKLMTMGNDLGTVGTLTTLAVTGTLALVAAVAAAASAFIAGALAATKYAIAVASTHRNQEQTLRAMTQSNDKASQLNGAFETISKGTGISADRLSDMTDQLTTAREQMGLAQLSGNQLERALYGLAQQEQARGNSSRTGAFIDQLNSGTKSVDQFANEMDRKFGNVVEKKMLGLDQQMATLSANLSDLFDKVNIEGFLRGLSRMIALFDSSTASGKAIQTLFDAIFGPTVGDNADRFFIGLERMFLTAELAALKFGIFVKRTWKQFNDAIDGVHLGPLGDLRDRLNDLKGPAADVATWLLGMLNPLTAITQTLGAAGDVFSAIGKGLKDAYDTGKKWVDKIIAFGDAIVTGLRDKIAGGADKVASAVSGMMTAATQAGKDAIGMHSPPRAYLEIGHAITDATASSIADGVPDVGAAVESMLSPPAAPAGARTNITNAASVSGNTFHLHGVENGDDAVDRLEDMFVELLNRRNDQAATEAPA